MSAIDRKIIAAIIALALILVVVLLVITLLGASAWIEFGVLIALLAVILLGSYWFVILPGGNDRRGSR